MSNVIYELYIILMSILISVNFLKNCLLLQKLFCSKAKLILRKKKFQESLIEKTDGQLENIERMVCLIDHTYNVLRISDKLIAFWNRKVVHTVLSFNFIFRIAPCFRFMILSLLKLRPKLFKVWKWVTIPWKSYMRWVISLINMIYQPLIGDC